MLFDPAEVNPDGEQLYRDLMRRLPEGMTANGWAVSAGVNRTIWTDIRRHGNPSRRTLEKLLSAAGSSLAEFEALRVGPMAAPGKVGQEGAIAEFSRGWRATPLPPIPLRQCFLAGPWSGDIETLLIGPTLPGETIARPASLARSRAAFGFAYPGTAMRPRFRTGRVLLVAPDQAIVTGDDVLVELADGRAVIGEMIRRERASIKLRLHQPPREFAVPAMELAAIYRIAGEAM